MGVVKNKVDEDLRKSQSQLNDPDDDPVLVLTLEDIKQLSGLLSVNISGKDDLIRACKKVASINVEGQEVTFETALLHRLRSRCPSSIQIGPWLKERVIEWAHGYVGW